MAHELFGERFLSHRKPAWHQLGHVLTERVTAVQALRIMGEYTIHCEPLYLKSGQEAPRQAVIRDATAKGEAAKIVGTVGPDFRPIGPLATCSVYDEAVNVPVETIGCLRDGETLFISTKLPTVDVRGDEVENYLLVVNPMGGGTAAQVRVTPMRVVCMNTLVVGQRMSTETYRVVHDENAQSRLYDFLFAAYRKAEAHSKLIKEACDVLANHYPVTEEVSSVLEAVYPDPRRPINSAPDEVMVRRIKRTELSRDHLMEHREQARMLWNGKGTGMNVAATEGTSWGLYNSVCEYEDCRWAKDPQSAIESSVFGARANTKVKAFEACCDVAGVRS